MYPQNEKSTKSRRINSVERGRGRGVEGDGRKKREERGRGGS